MASPSLGSSPSSVLLEMSQVLSRKAVEMNSTRGRKAVEMNSTRGRRRVTSSVYDTPPSSTDLEDHEGI